MNIVTNYTIDHLTTESVSVKKQRALEDKGVLYPLGDPVRTAYTKESISELADNIPEPFLSAVLDVWGIGSEEKAND